MVDQIRKNKIRERSQELGVTHLGFTTANPPEHFSYYTDWVERGFAGDMKYLTEKTRKEKRGNLLGVFPEVQSVIVATFSYKPKEPGHPTDAKFARYGWGKDYHDFVKEKLTALAQFIQDQIEPDLSFRVYVDTGPILEKNLAQRAGAGWIGKNTCLIDRKFGSYLYVGVILSNLLIEPDPSSSAHCGTCTRCLDACPTDAFVGPYRMDATKCISYHTIENKSPLIPEPIASHLSGYVAGCDICQEVCPWNKKAPASSLSEVVPGSHVSLTLEDILSLNDTEYERHFGKTSFRRISLEKLKSNARYNKKTDNVRFKP